MTVSAFILDPQNDFERNFFIPVATELFFNKYWLPAIESLGLQWTLLFSTGVDVEEEDIPHIFNELLLIKEWADKNLGEEEKNKMFERIARLQVNLPLAFQRKNTVVFIG
jgi:hypothetical protein